MEEIALRDCEVSILGDIHNLTSYSPELHTHRTLALHARVRLPTSISFWDSVIKPNEKRKSKLCRDNKVTATKISQ